MNISSNTYKQSYFWLAIFWTLVFGRKDPKKYDVSVSIHPSVCLPVFSELTHHFILKLSMLLGPIYSYMWQSQIFWKKSPSGENDQKYVKNGPQPGFLDFLRKSCH